MRNSRNGNGRSSRSNRQFADQRRYGNNIGSDYRQGNEDESNREDGNRGQDQDYDRRNYSNRGFQSQPYGTEYDRGMRNDYGNNSYTDNEDYDQGGGYRGNMGRDYSEDYGRMGGSYGSGSGSEQSGNFGSSRGTSSFNTNRSGRWGSSVESMRGRGPKGYRRSDERIQEQLNDVLTDDDMLDASQIEVTVKNGEVSLSGTVDSREAKRRAEDLAEGVSGVTNVENRIRVSNGSSENRGSQGGSSQESEKSRSGQTTSQNKNKTHQNAEA